MSKASPNWRCSRAIACGAEEEARHRHPRQSGCRRGRAREDLHRQGRCEVRRLARTGAGALQARARPTSISTPRASPSTSAARSSDLAPLEAAFRVMRALAEQLRGEGIAHRAPRSRRRPWRALFQRTRSARRLPSTRRWWSACSTGFDIALVVRTRPHDRRQCGRADLARRAHAGARRAPIVVLDAAMNDLIRPAIYDAYHGIKPRARNADGRGASLRCRRPDLRNGRHVHAQPHAAAAGRQAISSRS